MIDFFISYTRADRAWAEWIAWVLETEGLTTRIQAWDFRPGSNFIAEMNKAAAEARGIIAVLSPAYLASHFGEMEWTVALAQEKGLLPVRVREVELGGPLAEVVYTDLVGLTQESARNALLAAASQGRLKPLTKPPFPQPSFPGASLPFPLGVTDLPETKLPEIGPLPAGSRMPLAINPLFVGRQEELRALARQLKVGEPVAIGQITAASGLGGVGKTQLAAQFVHRYGRYFDGGVFWMSFADPAAVPAEIAACGKNLDLHPSYDSLPLDWQVRMVEEVWARPVPRLLVFDNCEEETLLARWRPRTGAARVLLTSRRQRWNHSLGVQSVPISTLPRFASIELLRKFRPDLTAEDPALFGIASEVGDLPLALHLAGSFLVRYAASPVGQPAAYLGALRQGGLLQHPSLQGAFAGFSPTSHEAHVGRTFALSIEKLSPVDPTDALSLALLARAAWFASGEPIPRTLLLKTVDLDSTDPLQDEDALSRLTALGLLDVGEDGGLVMHRLVAELARGSGEEARNAVEESLLKEADRLNIAGIPGPLLAWQPHLRAITERARSRNDANAAGLCNALGDHLEMIGDYQGARSYYERALSIWEKVLGAEHPETARSLNNLGVLLQSQGDLAGARPYVERALAINEKVLGAEHPETALSLNNLGFLLQGQGDLTAARPYIERALSIWEKVLGAEHPETARSLNNLGFLLQSQGDLAAARPYVERALAINEEVLGAEHPETALSLNNLGLLLQSQGDLAAAWPHYERALAINERVLGTEHPETALSLNNLGVLLQSQGDLAAARPYYERALAIQEKVLGAEHPDTARSLNNLGLLLQSQGDLAAAWGYYERALAIQEKVLGAEHPDTARSLNNLGLLFQSQGDLAAARPYYERALAIQEKVLGAEHPETARSLNNLGLLLQSQGDLAAARPYYERALAIWEKVLGAEHPDTVRSLNNLGVLLQSQGDLARARSYYERALKIWEKVLGAKEELPQPVPPAALIQACRSGESVLYAGMGLSAAAGFPIWHELVRGLVDWAAHLEFLDSGFAKSLRVTLDQGDADPAADAVVVAAQERDPASLRTFLRDIFLRPVDLPPAHRFLRTIPFSATLTPSLDDLLERTFADRRTPVFTPQESEPLLDAISKHQFFILKLAGTLQGDGDSLLIAPAQYDQLISGNLPFSRCMETLFFSRTLLFIGASLEGIEFYLRGIAYPKSVQRLHYALVAVTGRGWLAKANLLQRRYGIQVIPYTASKGHPEVARFLELLQAGVSPPREGATAHDQVLGATDVQSSGPLRSVTLENIGPFETLTLSLHSHWNILLGDNGTGKSTILKAIATAIAGKDAELFAHRLIRSGQTSAAITLETGRNVYRTLIRRQAANEAQLQSIPGRPLEAEGWLALGFPPLRTGTWNRPKAPEAEVRGRPAATDLLPLIQGELDPRLDRLKQWIVNLDYWIKDELSRSGNGGRYERLLQTFFRVIGEITEGLSIEFKEVRPQTNEVVILTDDGELPIEALSQGTVSLMSWVGSLLQRLYEIHGDDEEPTQQPALVLMDEIDAHLHPAWQRTLVKRLSNIFPHVQFIATTHSPLVVAGLEPDQVVRFERDEEGRLVRLQVDAAMLRGRADQILTGDLFGLDTTVDPVTEQKMDRYRQLLGKSQRSPDEEAEFIGLRRILQARIPVAREKPVERQAQELLEALLQEQVGADFPDVQSLVMERAAQIFQALQKEQRKPS